MSRLVESYLGSGPFFDLLLDELDDGAGGRAWAKNL
jgi:hypothetical protein